MIERDPRSRETKPEVSWFVYYGATRQQDKVVRMYKGPKGWVVEIEGHPQSTIRNLEKDKALGVFDEYYQGSFNDWGASEIHWAGED